jgi:hypothetical protein
MKRVGLLAMPNSESIDLSLLENSHAFLKEAVAKALAASADIRHWQFAILNLVQSLELSLKAALKNIHPVLIFENIDGQKNTVSLTLALDRLEDPKIGNLTFSDVDKSKIRHAVRVRNQITHSDFAFTRQFAAAKFFEIFAFVSEFQRRHLGTKISNIIPSVDFGQLVKIRDLLVELAQRARGRIAEEKIDPGSVWVCPNCGEDAFVVADAADTCYACEYAEQVVECPHCSQLKFESEMESFVDDLDIDYDEGQFTVRNNYGYRDFQACPDCLRKIKEDVQRQRSDDEFRQLEEEYNYR